MASPEFSAENFDFDDFERQLAVEFELNEIKKELCDLIDAQGICRLIDLYPERQDELQTDYLRLIHDSETEKFRAQPGGEEIYIRGEHHEWVSLACFQSLCRQVELQNTAWQYAAQLIQLSRQPEHPRDQNTINYIKKMAQAVLYVSYNPEDPIESSVYEFFQEVAPGEGLNKNSLNDKFYIYSAATAMRRRLNGRIEIMARTKELAGIDDTDQSSRAAEMMMALTVVMSYALHHGLDKREYAIRDLAREYDLDNELVDKLVTFYVNTIPALGILH